MDDHSFDDLTRSLARGLTRRTLLRGLGGGLAATLGLARASASGQQQKKPLCHATGSPDNPWVVINVAEPAWPTHFAHGDTPYVDCCAAADCPAPTDPCLVAVCQNGVCGVAPGNDGAPCNDGNACTQTDTCQGGACVGTDPVVCDPPRSACELPGVCDRATGQCAYAPQQAGTVCREAAGPCDVAEVCDGVSTACPADAFADSTVICRSASGPCDEPASCTGSSPDCPPNILRGPETVCRPATGPCDVAEHCTGQSAECPPDALAAATVSCRAASGPCDEAAFCTGNSAGCPPNPFRGSETVCRPAAGPCDIAEVCTGAAASCPVDAFQAVGTICGQFCVSGAADAASVDTCDGNGTCDRGLLSLCGNYRCNAERTACRTSCTTNADCQSPATCVGGACQLSGGGDPGGGCFVAGTRIAMADGTSKPIELVAPGDLVVGHDGINQVRGIHRPVLGHRPLFALNDGSAFVTAGHPFLTEEGWKAIDPDVAAVEVPGLPVSRLAVGDRLLALAPALVAMGGPDESAGARWEAVPVRRIDGQAAAPATPLYNLLVDGDHTYVADELLVHNKECGC
jgi:hypothetical protein